MQESPLKGSRVLITGHTGFKGSWLARYLSRFEVELFGLSLEAEPNSLHERLSRSIYAQELTQDIRDKSLLRKSLTEIRPEYVFHLAAQPLVIASYRNPVETFETNVMGTVNLLDGLLSLETTRTIIVATTDKVYKNLENGQKYKESDALQGQDPYSASKVGTESVVRAWQNLAALEDRISITSVRAGNVIGGGDFAENRLLPDIVKSYINQEPLVVRNPQSTRPWQHVLDPIIGYVKAAEHSAKSSTLPTFNFGPSDSSLSVKQVVDIAKTLIHLDVVTDEVLPSSLHEASRLDLDSTLAKKVLHWENKWLQRSAVESTVSWWKSVLSGEISADEATDLDIESISNSSIFHE